MSTATLDYLMAHDSTPSSAWPDEFDHRTEMAKVRALGTTLSAIAGQPLRLDDKIEEASFFAEWAAFDSKPRPWPGLSAEVRLCLVAIRFSAHGHMFTVWGNCPDHPLTDDTVTAVTNCLEPLGYVHVPQSLLHAAHPTQGPDKTWCSRYFSYQAALEQPHIRGCLKKSMYAVV